MATTQPIRKLEDVTRLKNYFMERNEYRNYAFVTMGLNTALRVSDILALKWGDVYDFKKGKYRNHILLKEIKTKKKNTITINESLVEALDLYKQTLSDVKDSTYIVLNANSGRSISRVQAHRIVKRASEALALEGTIASHSFRKTFGYWAWKNGAPVPVIMQVFNHSSYKITERYLGISQDEVDSLFNQINL